MKKLALLAFTLFSAWNMDAKTITGPVDYVSPLVGTQSKHALSTGNTYPAIALPWGMNFWVPQTGKMGDGWAYTYDADKIRGFKQTHQPGSMITVSSPSCRLPVKPFSIRISVPAGSRIKQKRLLLTITKYTLPTMM